MIKYHRESWWSQVFVLRGGILELTWWPCLCYLFYCISVYSFGLALEIDHVVYDESSSLKYLGSFVSFLFVFRLNQCYLRLTHAITLTTELFTSLASLASMTCTYMKGDDPGPYSPAEAVDPQTAREWKLLAIASRVHVVRLVVAMGVSLKFHFRIAENALSGGRLDSEKVAHVLFDFHRLKALLYPLEQHEITEVCGLFTEAQDRMPSERGDREGVAEENHYRVALCYQSAAEPRGQGLDDDDSICASPGRLPDQRSVSHSSTPKPLFSPGPSESGHRRRKGGDKSEYHIGVPLPIPLITMLRYYTMQPLSQRWGYPERVLNLVEAQLDKIAVTFEELDRLITLPLPLAYLQHCKVLFLIFNLIYPLTISCVDGIWANVCSPCVLFFSLLGFENLADQLENPLGDDDVDLNILEMIHDLEVRVHQIFSMATTRRQWLGEESRRPLDQMRRAAQEEVRPSAERPSCDRESGFLFHFAWVPLPSAVVGYMLEKDTGFHAEVRTGDVTSEEDTFIRRPWSAFAAAKRKLKSCLGSLLGRLGYQGLAPGEEEFKLESRATHFLCLQTEMNSLTRVLNTMRHNERCDTETRVQHLARMQRPLTVECSGDDESADIGSGNAAPAPAPPAAASRLEGTVPEGTSRAQGAAPTLGQGDMQLPERTARTISRGGEPGTTLSAECRRGRATSDDAEASTRRSTGGSCPPALRSSTGRTLPESLAATPLLSHATASCGLPEADLRDVVRYEVPEEEDGSGREQESCHAPDIV